MTRTKFKEFLNCGAFLQIGPDTFNLVLGPFKSIQQDLVAWHSDQPLLFQPDFWDFLESKKAPTFQQGAECFTISRVQVMDLLNETPQAMINAEWQKPSEEIFKKQFEWSQQQFKKNELQKTVPIVLQKSTFQFTTEHLATCLKKLLSDKKYGWTYGFWSEGVGYLGHSPELLCEWNNENKLLNTMALAGTLPIGPTAAKELLSDTKNLDEHQIVIQDIVNKLKEFPSLTQEATESLELKYLVHLKTKFTVAIDSVAQAFSVIEKLHPTAALGVFPAYRAAYEELQVMQQPIERKNFAAPFALIHRDSVLAIAAIRNFHFTREELQIFSGCGVTKLSIYENELTELEQKRDSVKKMTGL